MFDDYSNEPTDTWQCRVGNCTHTVKRYRGQYDVTCECGAEYNSFGQLLRSDWRSNPSNYDDEIGDLEGWERSHSTY